jgi:proteic killer suppression protein
MACCAHADQSTPRRASRYTLHFPGTRVIRSFADRATATLFRTGFSQTVPADLVRRALRKLEMVHVAARLSDLRVPAGNRLHALHGDRHGQHAIRVNEQWRICFRFMDGHAYDVELCDYH